MSSSNTDAAIGAARAYEALFIPALIGEWAPQVADAARLQAGERVLDVACGTGVVAREAAARVGSGGRVSGIDPGAGMLALARELAPAIDWQEGVAEVLPYPDRAFDAVLCQFGLMFFGDRAAALREMLRVLKPGGRLVVAVWDRLEAMPAYADEVALFERELGRPAGDALRAPFVLGDAHTFADLVSAAGASEIAVATRRGTGRFPSLRVMVEADLRGWLPVVGIRLDEQTIQRTLREAEVVLRAYAPGGGPTSFLTSVHILSARRPQ